MFKVVIDDTIGETPAAISREYKTIYINPLLWNKLNDFQQKFVLLHELGHYYLNTKDEVKADAYAFSVLAGKSYRSLKNSINTIDVTLHDGNVTKAQRMHAIKTMALQWDYENGNKAVAEELRLMQEMLPFTVKVFGVELFKTDSASEQYRLQEANYLKAQVEVLLSKNKMLGDSVKKNTVYNKIQPYVIIGVVLVCFWYLFIKK